MQLQILPFLNAESPLNQLRIRLVQFVLTLLFLIGLFFSLSFFVSGNNIFSGANAIAPITSLFALGLFITVSRRQLINIISVLAIAYIIAIGVLCISWQQLSVVSNSKPCHSFRCPATGSRKFLDIQQRYIEHHCGDFPLNDIGGNEFKPG